LSDDINDGDADWIAVSGGPKDHALDGGRGCPGIEAILWVAWLIEKHWQ